MSDTALGDVRAHRARLDQIDTERERETAARDAALKAAYMGGATIAALSRASGLDVENISPSDIYQYMNRTVWA